MDEKKYKCIKCVYVKKHKTKANKEMLRISFDNNTYTWIDVSLIKYALNGKKE